MPDGDQTKALRALTRREVLVEQRVELCSQLRELERFWPGAVEIFADLDSPISLAFPERYPAPTRRAAGLETNARRGRVLVPVPALKPIVEQIRRLTSTIAHALSAHRDGEI